MQDAGIKGLFALLLLLFIGMRVYYYRKALYEGGAVTYHEPRLMLLVGIRLIGGVFLLSVLLLYFIAPQWLAWAALPLPFGLHLCGLFLGYSALLWLWWAQWTIGKNFSSILHARECHTLV